MIILNTDIKYTRESLKGILRILEEDSILMLKNKNDDCIILDNNSKEMLKSYFQGELIQKEIGDRCNGKQKKNII